MLGKFKKSNKMLAVALLIVAMLATSNNVSAKTKGYYYAYNQKTVNSIVGIPVFRLGVQGQYYTNGKKISKQTNAVCLNSTLYPGWSIQKESAAWTVKDPERSIVTNTSTFFYGLDTQWVKIGIQTITSQVQAAANP